LRLMFLIHLSDFPSTTLMSSKLFWIHRLERRKVRIINIWYIIPLPWFFSELRDSLQALSRWERIGKFFHWTNINIPRGFKYF
jgi:hypothetical protein